MPNQLIFNARVVTELEVIEDGFVHHCEGQILYTGRAEELADYVSGSDVVPFEEQIDAQGSWLLPGFIDVHVHGGSGCDFMNATQQALDTITAFHARHGTTAMLATTVTAPRSDLEQVLIAVSQYQRSAMPYAQLLGVHLEGPFISPRWPGAQNPSHITLPQREWLEDWHERYAGLVRIVTLAPEREGALELIAWLRDQQIVPACGHTDASYAEIEAAVRAGLTHAAHAFNAMKPLHHREPGTVGAVLTDDSISTEVIADGHHVHPAAIQLLVRMKQPHHLLLITDAMSAAGLGDGTYDIGGLPVTVQEGVARLTSNGSLAGSTLTMIDAYRYLVQQIGVSFVEASRFASMNPARLLHLEHRLGSIAKGKQADLLVMNDAFELQRVWCQGNQIF